MTIYEIDSALLNLVDEETGEIMDVEAFEALAMEKEHKVEGMALWVKELKAEASAIANEISNLQTRKKSAEHKAEQLKEYLTKILAGSKFKTGRCSISYTTSHPTEILDEVCFIDWAKQNAPEMLTFKEPTISLTAVKDAIKSGKEVPFAKIDDKISMVIK